MRKLFHRFPIVSLTLLLALGLTAVAHANGQETLGEPTISIATGSRVLSAGVGTETQPATFQLDVPTNVTIKQVLLYWSGATAEGTPGDNTIHLNGTPVSGEHIGTGPGRKWYESYRADITSLNLVAAGSNSYTVTDMDFVRENDGVSLLVIVDDGTAATIQLRDGLDIAYIDRPEPGQTTIAQSFTYEPENVDRTAEMTFFIGSVLKNRPSRIKVTIGGTVTDYFNLLSSAQGDQWDNLTVPITIPAGASDLTVQVLSEAPPGDDRLPASLTWINVTLVVPAAPPPANCANFATLTPGTSVEGFGAVHPYLNIHTTSGQAKSLIEGQLPAGYFATTPTDPRVANGALPASGGLVDFGRVHDYKFTFAPGVTVNDFQIRMFDYGDLNVLLATVHEIKLVAYDVNNNVVASDSFVFNSNGTILPPDLKLSGDAGTAVDGEPGNRLYHLAAPGITRLEFQYNSSGTPLPSDSHFALGELCFNPTSDPEPGCANFIDFTPGQPIQGLGRVHPMLNIGSTGQAIVLHAGQEPAGYYAMTPADPRFANGALPPEGGFVDISRLHRYHFTFSPGVTVEDFQIRMLDYGDLNVLLATEHEIKLVAYDSSNNVVATDSLTYTSDGKLLPRGGSAGDLKFTGDAGTAVDGEPGNHLYHVTGTGITRVEIQYNSSGIAAPSDSHFALSNLCFTPSGN